MPVDFSSSLSSVAGGFNYLISVSGSTYSATNNSTGDVYSGTTFSTVFQYAITNCPTYGTIKFKDGTFPLDTAGVDLKSNITIDFGKALLTWDTVYGTTYGGIRISGTAGAGTNLDSNAAAGARSVVSTGHGCAAGDLVIIRSTATGGMNQPSANAELHLVESVSGTTVYLVDALMIAYNTADTAKIIKLTPVKNVTLIGGTLQGTGKDDVIGFYSIYGQDITIRDMTVDYIDLASFMFNSCLNVTWDNVTVRNSLQSGYGYGVELDNVASHNLIVNSHFYNCRHCITHGSGLGWSQDTKIINCDFHDGTLQMVDAHLGCGNDMLIDGCTFNVGLIGGYTCKGVMFGGKRTYIYNSKFIFGTSASAEGYAISPRDDGAGDSAEELYVSNCHVINGSYGIQIAGGGDLLKRIVLNNFRCTNPYNYAVYISNTHATCEMTMRNCDFKDQGDATAVSLVYFYGLADFTIDGTKISTAQRAGIRCDGATAGSILSCDIKNNGNAGAGYRSGVVLSAVTYVKVSNNRIYDTRAGSATQTYGVESINASDYLQITDNYLRGNTSGGVAYTGTNNTIKQNVGYVTENSGTATLLNGQTSVTVTHGCGFTPTLGEISIVWGENPTNLIADWWIDTIGTTTFKLNGVDPGASNLDFGWSIRRT
jgi:hypothetical protein